MLHSIQFHFIHNATLLDFCVQFLFSPHFLVFVLIISFPRVACIRKATPSSIYSLARHLKLKHIHINHIAALCFSHFVAISLRFFSSYPLRSMCITYSNLHPSSTISFTLPVSMRQTLPPHPLTTCTLCKCMAWSECIALQ